ETGQYVSPDPIKLAGGIRPYGYVHNPLTWIDFFGLSPSGELNKALGGVVGDGLQAHHVIPVDVWNNNASFFNDIGMNGMRDTVGNGILMPGSQTGFLNGDGKGMAVYHSSRHDYYSLEVDDLINDIKREFYGGNISKDDARRSVKKLQMKLKQKIWSGDVPQTCCKRIW
ncbi:AHH domain-containing protein, partial [Citrobacter sp. wls619]